MSVKLSVTMPSVLYDKLERMRQGKGMARSLAVQEALESWVAAGGNGLDAEYLGANRVQPESSTEMDAWESAGAEAWGKLAARRSKKATPRGVKREKR